MSVSRPSTLSGEDRMRQRGARLLVTARSLHTTRLTRRAVERALPASWVRDSGFGGILLVDAEGDPLELAEAVVRGCAGRIGRVVAVLAEVASDEESTRAAAVRVGAESIGAGQSFCFRLRKRDGHGFARDARAFESEVGSAIWEALERRHATPPRVDLEDPDVMVSAEVLGEATMVGICRKSWRREIALQRLATARGSRSLPQSTA